MSRALISLACAVAAGGTAVGHLLDSAPHADNATCITKEDVDATIDAFMAAVVSVGKLGGNCTAAREASLGAIDAAYAYHVPGVTVLFKPTLTEAPHVYRPTRQGALSYFVGRCACPGAEGASITDASACSEAEGYLAPDTGFGFAPSHGFQGYARVERSGDFRYNLGGAFCGAAVAQGPICFTAASDGSVDCVDKTFGLVPNPDPSGPLRAVLGVHHSSLIVAGPAGTTTRAPPEEDNTSGAARAGAAASSALAAAAVWAAW